MNYEKLTAVQALEIANLEQRVAAFVGASKAIHMLIYGIGGPLNDNRLGYTPDQRKDFYRIYEILEESEVMTENP